MAVQPKELLVENGGRLDRRVVWPGLAEKRVLERLTKYLEDADEQPSFGDITDATASDRARKVWAYYRAKDEQYQRMIGHPAQVSDADEGSQAYTSEQIQAVAAERDEWLLLFETIVEDETGATDTDSYAVIQSLR